MNVSSPNQPMFRGCETRNTGRTLGVNLIQPSAPDPTYEDGHRDYSEENVMETLQGFPSVCHEREWGTIQDIKKVPESLSLGNTEEYLSSYLYDRSQSL